MRTRNRWLFLLLTLGGLFLLVACASEPTPTPTAEVTPTVEATSPPAAAEDVTEVEPNDEVGSATEISPGTATGILDEDDVDWYSFEVPDGHVLQLTFTAGDAAEDMAVELKTPDRELVWRKEGMGAGESRSTTQLMGDSSGGRYYLSVPHGQGTYTFDLSLEGQDDAGQGRDAGDDPSAALEVETEGSFSGRIGDFDEGDWYSFEVPDGHKLELTFTAGDAAEDMVVELENPDRELVWRKEGIGAGESRSTTLAMDDSSGGRYYLYVAHGQGTYTIDLWRIRAMRDRAGMPMTRRPRRSRSVPWRAQAQGRRPYARSGRIDGRGQGEPITVGKGDLATLFEGMHRTCNVHQPVKHHRLG